MMGKRWRLATLGTGALMISGCGPYADVVDSALQPRRENVCCRGTDSAEFTTLAGGTVTEVPAGVGVLSTPTHTVRVDAVAVTNGLDPEAAADIDWEHGGGLVEPTDDDEIVLALISLVDEDRDQTAEPGKEFRVGIEDLPESESRQWRRPFALFGAEEFAGEGRYTVVLGVVVPIGGAVVLAVAGEGEDRSDAFDLRTGRTT